MPPLLVRLIFDTLSAAKVPFFTKPIVRGVVDKIEHNYTAAELRLHAEFLDAKIGQQPYFAGEEFSAADIQMSYPVEALVDRGRLPDSAIRNLRGFVGRIRERPAYQRALAKGGKVF
jgi:glutathione S-transferase